MVSWRRETAERKLAQKAAERFEVKEAFFADVLGERFEEEFTCLLEEAKRKGFSQKAVGDCFCGIIQDQLALLGRSISNNWKGKTLKDLKKNPLIKRSS